MMKTKDLPEITSALYAKLQSDGYSDTVLDNTRWILKHFENYCIKKEIPEITVPVAAAFVQECFGFDYYNLTARMQSVLRRPLMILIEFEESGNYLKTHQKGSTTEIPLIYKDVFLEYRETVNGTSLCQKSKERKFWVFTKYFEYLENQGITELKDITFQAVHDYVNSLDSFAPGTLRCIKGILREIYDWLYSPDSISLFPEGRHSRSYAKIPEISCYLTIPKTRSGSCCQALTQKPVPGNVYTALSAFWHILVCGSAM